MRLRAPLRRIYFGGHGAPVLFNSSKRRIMQPLLPGLLIRDQELCPELPRENQLGYGDQVVEPDEYLRNPRYKIILSVLRIVRYFQTKDCFQQIIGWRFVLQNPNRLKLTGW